MVHYLVHGLNARRCVTRTGLLCYIYILFCVQQVEFDKKCESLDKCTSDLRLNVEMFLLGDGVQVKVTKNTTLYVDSAHELLVSDN